MRDQASHTILLTRALICSILVHLTCYWILDSTKKVIIVESAGQQHVHVRLAYSAKFPERVPEKPIINQTSAVDSKPETPIKPPLKPLNPQPKMAQEPKQALLKSNQVKPVPQSNESIRSNKQQTINAGQIVIPDEAEPVRKTLINAQESKALPAPLPNKEIEGIASEPTETAAELTKSNNSPSNKPIAASHQKVPRYHLGSVANPEPEYPDLARKKGWEGDVILGVHVAADGSIKHLTFVKSTHYGVLNHAAYETVRTQWRFDKLDDENVQTNSYIEVPISFRIN